ncbi:MAG: peptidoglycan-binding protein [Chloroflexi bacterium]|nr:peptidoglycan-binding protein [Chloroflexota bacterium]
MRRKLLITGAAVVILGVAAAGSVLAWRSAATQPAANPALPPATATITRTTLVETRTLPGTLGYGDPVPVSTNVAGTLTWIAPVRSTVKRGEPLFKVDERPVVALYGSVPLYRTLRVGAGSPMSGADVQQLQKNLAELGYGGFIVDGAYTSATAEGVRAWQAGLGLPETGTVELGQVVFTPGAIRIAEHTARVGDVLGERGVPVLSYTDTTRLVIVALPVADQALAIEGSKVTVKVPGRKAGPGEISRVGTVVTGGINQRDARIQVTVTIADQEAFGSLDAAPVDVDFVSEERKDVLAVPVAALLALADGGFGVEIVDGSTARIVPVRTGMFAAGRVEVSGEGIADGVTVGVPR